MTIDEAIKHCLEVAEENDLAAETYEILAENNHSAYERLTAETNSSRCAECAADHRQLAEWLTELKELEAKHWDECRQIAHYDDEIKRLEAADVQPVKHGEWDFQGYQLFKCTNCKEMFTQDQLEAMQNHKDCEECAFPNFCPNCGARMIKDGDKK